MVINGKEIALTFKTRQMIEVAEKVGKIYDLELGAYEGDLHKLGKLISIFGSLDYEASLDKIDELLEAGVTVKEIYGAVFEEINKKGFFTRALELTEIAPIDMDKMTSDMVQKAQMEMGEQYINQMVNEETSKNMSKVSRK